MIQRRGCPPSVMGDAAGYMAEHQVGGGQRWNLGIWLSWWEHGGKRTSTKVWWNGLRQEREGKKQKRTCADTPGVSPTREASWESGYRERVWRGEKVLVGCLKMGITTVCFWAGGRWPRRETKSWEEGTREGGGSYRRNPVGATAP